ncbi:hypothetical protein Pan265_06000 [Mucisphaera calidilacus]|uniref:site-specific DNA-methyltransferase (cytosine-N(4)-specific) n=2 Tax=Mucisphaera calidilacus TaxID=2527982 RepID=A0A518BV04_9BACT|nr:hypothetical protein Pan265_06000 [Mucisphaera calidilacus]
MADELERSSSEYRRRRFQDLPRSRFRAALSAERLWVPDIPNIEHWFRRYVLLDLARLLNAISSAPIGPTARSFLHLCFAATIRASSNADPVPVSGLEVTSHMLAKDADGRTINPFAIFRRHVTASLKGMTAFSDACPSNVVSQVAQRDAATTDHYPYPMADVAITSPPYNGAVDYYRRHTLEMYWLGFTETREQRLGLLDRYIGRPSVPMRHKFVTSPSYTPLIHQWESTMRSHSEARANAFLHYCTAMRRVFAGLYAAIRPGGRAIFVVGRSNWNGRSLPTDRLMHELAGDQYDLEDVAWYPIKNRYMSYSRHNNANINREYVLIYRRIS